MAKTALLSAGGTGGHLFPAQALAQELKSRGWTIHLATDPRAKRFVDQFPADEVHIVESATFKSKNPIALAKTAMQLALGYLRSRKLISQIRPSVVVGFGGYPTVPPLLAATHCKVPTILHEQNAVVGRANRFLANRVTALAGGFDLVDCEVNTGLSAVVTGNPLRQAAHDAAVVEYDQPNLGGEFRLLVFGGSQGASFFSQIVPEALALMQPNLFSRLKLTLQARSEDIKGTTEKLSELNIECDVSEFFADLPDRIARSQMVICRSGASSVSELALIGRPSLLVPLPGALDDDQGANALLLEQVGGGQLIRQKELSEQKLCEILSHALQTPEALAIQAENAKKAGVPDAAIKLADLVESNAL